MEKVLDALHQHNLSVNMEKSEFHVRETVFLGYLISENEVRMEPSKVEAVRNWPVPRNTTAVRRFLGFTNFYRMFIRYYGKIARPLYELTKTEAVFTWGREEQEAFKAICDAVTAYPVLKLPDPRKQFEVETDASDYAMRGQLGQRNDQGKLHPLAFFSKKLEGPRRNYPIHDKELLAVIEAFQEWRPYLSGTTKEVLVYTDRKSLRYFTITKVLNGWQTRWAEFLAEFNFQIDYKKESGNARADALSAGQIM